MENNDFMLLSIQGLLERFFFIPRYQRGYRWGTQQVWDLLSDIDEIDALDPLVKYCLQPLVVKRRESDCFVAKKDKTEERDGVLWYLVPSTEAIDCNASFEVIDGQQRLTTIFIILKYLGVANPYSIVYETRNTSKGFLENLPNDNNQQDSSIDFCYMRKCYDAVRNWFSKKDEAFKESYKKKLLTKVHFIWYEDSNSDPVQTFTRLNIGKIALTNAELIKAMLLKQSNFKDASSNEAFRLLQLEMATQWDEIEYTLQNDEFWYFIHPQNWQKPTRIDFVFELIKEMKLLNFLGENLGNDNYTTFRYFYQYLKSAKGTYNSIWNKVREIFQIFKEWYDNAEFYHYIGFLTSCGDNLANHVKEWQKYDKQGFITYLKNPIKSKLGACSNLDKVYDAASGDNAKTACKPLLLLFNLQTIINQNRGYRNKYGQGVFQKFPFHLYRQESWDVEHIDSATENDLSSTKDQIEWLRFCYLGLKEQLADEIKTEMQDFLKNPQADNFKSLQDKIIKELPQSQKIPQKDSVGNFVLLDSNTNRGYGNAIYPAKRTVIMGRDRGKCYVWASNNELDPQEENTVSPFIPPCTRNVFMKYYTPNSSDIMTWSLEDANAYKKNIYETLKEFWDDKD